MSKREPFDMAASMTAYRAAQRRRAARESRVIAWCLFALYVALPLLVVLF